MLFQPSNISPSTLSGIGAGTVDVTLGVTVSWQVNGDTPMTAYQITIYQNDSASTQKYTTGKITLSQPFQPHDKNGNPQFFSTQISAANLSSAGVVNGYANGYKLLITQWWSANDYVTQTSASVFNTLQNPTLTIDTISGTSISETITATYSQAQGDPISTVEWIFAVAGSESDPIKQTGTVTTQILSFDVDGLMDGTTYSIECNVVTASGVYISTGFVQFTVSYSITTETLSYTLGQVNGTSGVYLSWDAMSATPITGYEVYRKESDIPYLKHVATTSSNLREVVDYAVASQSTVKYVIISMNGTTQKSIGETSEISPVFWDYSILLCYTDSNGYYHVNQEFRFGLAVETGAMSNGNDPTMQLNFTKYPNRQPMASLYKSGTLKSYIGSSDSAYQYHDSISLQDAIYAISTSRLTKFYKNRKGDVLMVDTNSAISMQTMDNSPKQAMQATINWSEVGEARGESIISQPSDAFFPITVTYVYEEVRGSVASFVSKYVNEPLKSLTAAITPVQSFNGYERPWAAGAGKNKAYWPTLTNSSSSDVDYTILDDGNTLRVEGTASAESTPWAASLSQYANMPLGPYPAGEYTIIANGLVGQNTNDRIAFTARYADNSSVSGGSGRISGKSNAAPDGTGRAVTFTATDEFKIGLYMVISSGTSVNCDVKIQLEKASSVGSWEPYANICPITGWGSANIYDDPKYGGMINWNQRVKVNPFVIGSGQGNMYGNRATLSLDNGKLKSTANPSGTTSVTFGFFTRFESTGAGSNAGHKIYISAKGLDQHSADFRDFRWFLSSSGTTVGNTTTIADGKTTIDEIVSLPSNAGQFNILCRNNTVPVSTDYFTMDNLQIFDLTQMFGDTVADQIYALEQGEAGVGVAYFRSLFPNGQYAFNTGTSTCVSAVNGETYLEKNIVWAGINLFDEANATVYKRYMNSSDKWMGDSGSGSYAFPCKANTDYVVTASNENLALFRVGYINDTDISGTGEQIYSVTRLTGPGTIQIHTGANATYLIIQCTAAYVVDHTAQVQIELDAVYGGTLDVLMGKLKARPQYASYNGETLVGPWLSSMDVYEEGVTPTTGAQVVDLGGTETEHILTAQQVNALLGQNNVWANTGDVDVEYLKDKVISKK